MFKYLLTRVLKKNFKLLSAFTVLLNQPFHLSFAMCVYQNSPLFTSNVVLVGRSNPLLTLSSSVIPCQGPQECKGLTTVYSSHFSELGLQLLEMKWQLPKTKRRLVSTYYEHGRFPKFNVPFLECNSLQGQGFHLGPAGPPPCATLGHQSLAPAFAVSNKVFKVSNPGVFYLLFWQNLAKKQKQSNFLTYK